MTEEENSLTTALEYTLNEEDFLPKVIDIKKLTKTYMMGQVPVEALRGVSLSVRKGEFIAVIGPSGSGKSTLLNMIGALDRPTSGTILINGVDVSTLGDNQLADLRQSVGFVYQTFNLISRLDALGNVELPLSIVGIPKKNRKFKAAVMLKIVGLGDRMHHKPSELSGGERQRVAVARALVTNPAFIIMDEPTGNLDTKTGLEIMEFAKKLNREHGITLIIVTHDPEIGNQARRIIRLRDGLIESDEVN
ncbi:MAG: ABC transporter ATP-binding protein [Candidatus Thorarchaeota archaeon]|nr:ABC transporter ATP-binding protein [Candidatus Thorarchaeota archaeon]